MPKYKPSASPCPIGRASRILGDRWAMLILRDALLGETRFDGWLNRMPISRAVLSDRLAMLCKAGLLQRDPPDGKRALYRLTEAGKAIAPIYAEITKWGDAHVPRAPSSEAQA
ncbi:MAG: helix-turn-helix domain-containing protein [Pseudomonadota bacterium]